MIKPVDPVQRRETCRFEIAPRTLFSDNRRLLQAGEGPGPCVVTGIADVARRGFNSGFGQAPGVTKGLAFPTIPDRFM